MVYSDFFGTGTDLYAQLVTIIGVLTGIIIWLEIYKRIGIFDKFMKIAFFPLLLWIVFGTLDITITTRCAYLVPQCEGTAESQWFFENFGFFGGAIVSLAWISLWAGIMAALVHFTKKSRPNAKTTAYFFVLAILYSLFIWHLAGLSTWLTFTQGLSAFFRQFPEAYWNFFAVTLAGLQVLTKKFHN